MSELPYGDYRADDPRTTLPASTRLLVDEFLRDPQILAAPDGCYYLTGTVREPGLPDALTWNRGVALWRSRDLTSWEDLGLVWKLDDGPDWLRRFAVSEPEPRWMEPEEFFASGNDVRRRDVRRCVWAPEIHFHPGLQTYVIAASCNANMGIPVERWVGEVFGGTFLLRSTTGRPEGPYAVTSPRPLTDTIDTSLFVEDDGRVFMTWNGGRSAQLSPELDSLTLLRGAWQTNFPRRESYTEGETLIKHDGRYFLFQSVNGHRRKDGTHTYGVEPDLAEPDATYDLLVSSSAHLARRFGPRRTVLVGGGHGTPFRDHEGRWWTTAFTAPGNRRPEAASDGCRPRLVPLTWVNGEPVVDQGR